MTRRRKENIVMSVLLVIALAMLAYGIMTTDFTTLYAGVGKHIGPGLWQ